MYRITQLAIPVVCFLFAVQFLFGQSELARADQYYQMGDYSAAVVLYRQQLDANPSDQDVLLKMLGALSRLNKHDLIYETLATKDPSRYSSDIKMLMGHSCKRMEKYDEAMMWYRSVRGVREAEARHFYASCQFAKRLSAQAPLYRSESLAINTSHSDYGAFVMEGRLYFSSHRADIKRVVKRKEQVAHEGASQLYYIDLADVDRGALPSFLRADLKAVFGESDLTYSEDGKYAAMVRSSRAADGLSQTDPADVHKSIYIAEADASGDWNFAEPFEYNSTVHSNAWPFLMNRGKTMYFASNRAGGYGGYDIYVTHRKNGRWSIPKNLGPKVNTPGNEITPVLNNGSLYFASDWHQGLGGMDLFRAEIVKGVYSRVYHLGRDINSSWDDFGLHIDPSTGVGYFSSNRPGGRGAEDIYACKKIAGQLSLLIQNAHDKSPVPNAEVHIEGLPVMSANNAGECVVNLAHEDPVSIVVRAEGFYEQTKMVRADLKALSTKYYVIKLNPKLARTVATRSVIDSRSVIETAKDGLLSENQSPVGARSAQDAGGRNALTKGQSKAADYGLVSSTKRTENGTPLHRPVQTKSKKQGQIDPQFVAKQHRSQSGRKTVWAVQLASFSHTVGRNVDISPYKVLYDLGTIYKKEVAGATKIRLGTFTSQQDAKSVMSRIRARGFKDVFLVSETEIIDISARPKRSNVASSVRTANSSAVSSRFAPLSEGYKIRLAALRQVEKFDSAGFGAYGAIEYRPHGDYTVIYLSGYTDVEQAMETLRQIKRAGAPDAYVVVYTNGVLSKIE